MQHMPVFVNRTLNLKRIKLIGFDMDYTLVAYHTQKFEELTYTLAKKRLTESFSYPQEVQELVFDFHRAVVGLVIDRRNGYLLQLSRFYKVKTSYFGLEQVDFREQNRIYGNMTIDLRQDDFVSLDTSFAISLGVLFSQIVQLKREGSPLPSYSRIEEDIRDAIDSVHRDGSLKQILKNRFPEFVVRDPNTAKVLERYRAYGKKLMIITNSDYEYTKALLDYTLNPFLQHSKSWEEVFDLVITLADKPLFFERASRFLKIDPSTGLMSNHTGPVTSGIFQGGCSRDLERSLGIPGNEILYLGDHIYGDVVSIKRRCTWRTALVLGDLEREMEGISASLPVQKRIDQLMGEKDALEQRINEIDILAYEGKEKNSDELDRLYHEIDHLNEEISSLLQKYVTYFNPYWGPILRAGFEESLFAEQLEKYACIYMTRVSDLYNYSPRTYFRPNRRLMPHELHAWEGNQQHSL